MRNQKRISIEVFTGVLAIKNEVKAHRGNTKLYFRQGHVICPRCDLGFVTHFLSVSAQGETGMYYCLALGVPPVYMIDYDNKPTSGNEAFRVGIRCGREDVWPVNFDVPKVTNEHLDTLEEDYPILTKRVVTI